MNSSIFEQNSFMDGEAPAEEAALASIRFLDVTGYAMAEAVPPCLRHSTGNPFFRIQDMTLEEFEGPMPRSRCRTMSRV